MLLALVFWITAFLFATVPDLVLADVEITLDTPSAFAEVRAAYGGSFLGYGLLCFHAARRPTLRGPCLGLCTLVLGAFAALRLLSFLVDGAPNPHSMFMHGLESLGFLISLSVWIRFRRGEERKNVD